MVTHTSGLDTESRLREETLLQSSRISDIPKTSDKVAEAEFSSFDFADSDFAKCAPLGRAAERALIKEAQALYKESLSLTKSTPYGLVGIWHLGDLREREAVKLSSLYNLGETAESGSSGLAARFDKLVEDAKAAERKIAQAVKEVDSARPTGGGLFNQAVSALTVALEEATVITQNSGLAPSALDHMITPFREAQQAHSELNPRSPFGIPLDSAIERAIHLYESARVKVAIIFNSEERSIEAQIGKILSGFPERTRNRIWDDCMQEGRLALVKAFHNFDSDRGLRFHTYAAHWVTAAVRQYLYDNLRTIRLPVYLAKDLKNETVAYESAIEDFEANHGRLPSAVERTELPQISEAVEAAMRVQSVNSLNLPTDKDNGKDEIATLIRDSNVIDPLKQTAQTEERNLLLKTLCESLAELDPREREVLTRRFGLNGKEDTLKEVGELLGVSVERIRQIQNRAIEKMRINFGHSIFKDVEL